MPNSMSKPHSQPSMKHFREQKLYENRMCPLTRVLRTNQIPRRNPIPKKTPIRKIQKRNNSRGLPFWHVRLACAGGPTRAKRLVWYGRLAQCHFICPPPSQALPGTELPRGSASFETLRRTTNSQGFSTPRGLRGGASRQCVPRQSHGTRRSLRY